MIESNIIRDVSSNYLTLTSDMPRYSGYEIKMFAGKHIPGFLDMTLRRVNEKNVYQYKILSYESMSDRYSKESFGKQEIKNLITALIRINITAGEFLLRRECILLNPQYVYMEGENIYFCYYPDNVLDFGDGIKDIMEYVLEHINHDDRDTIMTAYGLYQRILKNSYTLESLMETFENKDEIHENKNEENITPIQYVREESAYTCSPADEIPEEESIIEKIKKFFNIKSFDDKSKINKSTGTAILSANRLINVSDDEEIMLIHYPFVIGSKHKNCDHVINSPLISRKHAIIWNENGECYVEDVGSTNGTKINDIRIPSCEKIKLTPGDIVEFANIKFRFE